MPRPARRLLVALALATVVAVPGILALPAPVLAAPLTVVDAPEVLAPEEGAFVDPAEVVLQWTAVPAPGGYEVTWSSESGEGIVTSDSTSTTIQVDGGTFTWQVRALPDGEWSAPATFHADVELPTLPLPEQPAVAVPATPQQGFGAIPGSVWIIGALGFSAVFLAAVVIQSRVQRERDA